ncbi:hypothetical protein J1605_002510 [Eschrichtius robustus]|uniref:Macro domain-containing protein n=1 Tax=Eschrichtius robustus TaxID=9764 RepID=A0AB34HX96_ESCRO|nr:hypothetical protein J1605_002510 [Eschrichtius robustus]
MGAAGRQKGEELETQGQCAANSSLLGGGGAFPLVPTVRRSHFSISALLYRLPPHRPCPASPSLWMKPDTWLAGPAASAPGDWGQHRLATPAARPQPLTPRLAGPPAVCAGSGTIAVPVEVTATLAASQNEGLAPGGSASPLPNACVEDAPRERGRTGEESLPPAPKLFIWVRVPKVASEAPEPPSDKQAQAATGSGAPRRVRAGAGRADFPLARLGLRFLPSRTLPPGATSARGDPNPSRAPAESPGKSRAGRARPLPAVDGCIHRAAGPLLTDECRTLQSCETGKAKITCGYRLPAKYVIHTVGPIAHGEPSASQAAELRSCYLSSLDLLLEHRLRSVAFPCISTGVFGYPNEAAAEVVLTTLREWLEQHKDKVDRLIICVFLEKDENIYRQRFPHYFPVDSSGPTGPRSQL